MKISILTLTWNGLDKLKRLRPGLIRNLDKTGLDYTWYIRSNGCTDGTLEEIKTWDKVQILDVGHNRHNFAQGVNSLAWLALGRNVLTDPPTTTLSKFDYYAGYRARKRPSDDLLLLMNNDVEFPEDESISKMIACMKDNVGIVGCRLLYQGTNKLQHAGVIFSERYGNMPYHYRHQEESKAESEKNKYFQAVTAAVCLVRMSDFMAIDGMDEKFHWAFEDIDMNLRIGQLGRKIVYCGQTKIFHEESASLKKNPVNKLFMNPNVAHFKAKWLGKYHLDHTRYLADPNYNDVD